WNPVQGALMYALIVSPTGYGVWDMYGDDLAPSVSSRYVWGLLPNTYYYVDMCTEFTAGWHCSQSTFTTGPAESLPDRHTLYNSVHDLTSQVRLMTQGLTNRARSGTPLYQELLDHMRDPSQGTSCGIFTDALLDQLSPHHILGRYRQLSLDGMDG